MIRYSSVSPGTKNSPSPEEPDAIVVVPNVSSSVETFLTAFVSVLSAVEHASPRTTLSTMVPLEHDVVNVSSGHGVRLAEFVLESSSIAAFCFTVHVPYGDLLVPISCEV